MRKEPQPFRKKFAAMQRQFNDAVKKLNWKDVQDISKETLRDLQKPGEAFALAAAIVIPGGGIVYLAHRVRKHYLRQKPANDNPTPPKPPQNNPPSP